MIEDLFVCCEFNNIPNESHEKIWYSWKLVLKFLSKSTKLSLYYIGLVNSISNWGATLLGCFNNVLKLL